MKELDPGHSYFADVYPAIEGKPPAAGTLVYVDFRKRIGEGYPGNEGSPVDGTTTQELLRIIIHRTKYVDAQESHPANSKVIRSARDSIYSLEFRAASRRGGEYLSRWQNGLWDLRKGHLDFAIEDVSTCQTCGHILCEKH